MHHLFVAVLVSVFIAKNTEDGCLPIDGGGWKLVRYVPTGNTFHPATDNLAGTDVYGNPRDMSKAWSVSFSTTNRNRLQFLFAFGNCDKWLIADADVVLDDAWGYAQRSIYKSSRFDYRYTAGWYKRSGGFKEDPWISLEDHSVSKPLKDLLYGEDSYVFYFGGNYHNGASVYIRRKKWKILSLQSDFRRSDKDQDKCLNFDEISFDVADTNKDGELTSSEYDSAIAEGLLWDTLSGEDKITEFDSIDSDQDGMLTYDEIAFSITDTNKDGIISVEELSLARIGYISRDLED